MRIELAFHHFDSVWSYSKPVGKADEPGPSVLVNRTFVRENFRGADPERAKLTLIVESVGVGDVDERMDGTSARTALRFEHDDGRFVYFKPVDDDRARGASLLVNQMFVAEQFRGVDPERAKLTLTVENG